MKKSTPTRTTGPLHFEDLEPHRFEDLVRRLIYDFRPWRQLEATGRAGSDDSYDARGFEVVSDHSSVEANSDADDPEDVELSTERIWLIQCKRERTITPKKLSQYLDDVPEADRGALYGIVFAAACDFSKASRDTFRERTRGLGFSEAHLWGKGELEDMLYQPRNDDVLFTFFGISNLIRQRSVQTETRRKLTVKRKAKRLLEQGKFGVEVLLRDAADSRYPYLDDPAAPPRWGIHRFEGCRHDGLHFLKKRCLAFIDDDGASWDAAELMNDAAVHNNPWLTEEGMVRIKEFDAERQLAMAIWGAFQQRNKAWLEEFWVLPYESVIDIDEHGDEWHEGPHVYVSAFSSDKYAGPFREYFAVKLETIGQWDRRATDADPAKRVQKFRRRDPDAG